MRRLDQVRESSRGLSARRFILQARDSSTGCPVLEALLQVDDIDALRALLGLGAGEDPEIENCYEFGSEELPSLWNFVGFAFPAEGGRIYLLPWHPIRNVPYLVHTGFELALMLEGRKPLAVFSDVYPSASFDELLVPFESYVAEGRFVRRVFDTPLTRSSQPAPGSATQWIRRVLIALPEEQWRIAAYKLLCDVGEKAGWGAALERYEGSLLGYQDWENDWWAKRQNR